MRPLLLLLAALAATPAPAQDGGGVLFRQHCATCHGLGARGDGPMADILSIAMPDLTTLAARNGGFPMAAVIGVIDGRTPLRGHGGPMPVFGFSLGGDSVALEVPGGDVLQTRADALAIAQWLARVQE